MENEIIEVDGCRWKVRLARSLEDALNCISMARYTGSIGGKEVLDETHIGGSVVILADVVKVNSDNSERLPYSQPY